MARDSGIKHEFFHSPIGPPERGFAFRFFGVANGNPPRLIESEVMIYTPAAKARPLLWVSVGTV